MPNLVNYTPISIPNLMAQITPYMYNPSAIQRIILDNLYSATQGQADIVDPSNPFVFLLEASSVNTAIAIQESLINLQKQYPSLAQTFDDLYMHMSDMDYVNIFATPAQTNFTWTINLNELLGNLIPSPLENCKKAIIPRNTFTTVNGVDYSIQYPIEIKQFPNGSIQVMYDTTIMSPLQELSTNIISYVITTDASMVSWLQFSVPVSQFSLNSTSFPIQGSAILSEAIPFNGQYYYCRAYYQNTASGNNWVEIDTTYTQQVYDPSMVTLALSVDNTNKLLNIFLPPIYVESNLISGILRIDLYTTEGLITINLDNYAIMSFQTDLFAVDTVNDLSIFTTILPNITYTVYGAEIVQGGSNGLTFAQLQAQVINNTIGIRQLPITNVQLVDAVEVLGFQIIKNVDYITNRIFQATQSLPEPTDPTLITPAALSVNTLITNVLQLNNSPEVINNVIQSTILSKTLFVENNGILSIYPKASLSTLMVQPALGITEVVNNNNFFYSPFYYVLDYSDVEFSLRAYDLDSPSVSTVDFIYQNQTLQLAVNTGNVQISKTATGYQLTLTTASGANYQTLKDSYAQTQIAFMPVGEKNYAYLNGTLIGKTSSGERIWQFNISINYFIDNNDSVNFTNFNMFNTSLINVLASLMENFFVFYTTTSITTGYIPSAADAILGKFLLPTNAVVVTQEEITITFGQSLDNLWRRSLVNKSGITYETYPANILAQYSEIVYQIDPTTGSIFTVDLAINAVTYTILHNAGDPILDTNGNQIVLHYAGDTILGSNGLPVINTAASTQYSCDLLLVDGKYYFVTDAAYMAYQNELRSILNLWITKTLAEITSELLEQTDIYFYPQKSASNISVMTDFQTTVSINAKQSLTVNLYVNTSTYNNATIRNQLYINTIQTINTAIQNTVVSISEIMNQLKTIYGTSVISFNVKGLGGAANYDTITVINNNESLSLNKILQLQGDGSLIVQEDVIINFIDYSN